MNVRPSSDNPLWSPVPTWDEPPAELVHLLAEVHAELAALLGGQSAQCRACGECCDFRRQEHVLFATKLELDYALHWSRIKAPVSVARARAALEANLCPFWREGRCDIHMARPVGCRTFFCAASQKKVVSGQVESLAQRYRSKLMRHNRFLWYGPALAYWHVNVIAFSAVV